MAGDFQERGRVHGDCNHKDAIVLKYITASDVDSVVELVSATVHEPNVKRLMSLTMGQSQHPIYGIAIQKSWPMLDC